MLNRQNDEAYPRRKEEVTRVLKPLDLWALYIFLCIKVALVTDQACGTGGMLSTGYNFIKRYNPSADVRLFGQEINPESYAMCLAEMLIKGQNAENICYQDTMKADRFKGTKMRFVLEIIWSFIQAIQDVHDEAHSLLAA